MVRKIVMPLLLMLVCCGLSAPAGAATGQLLNTLHTPAMSYHGHKQVSNSCISSISKPMCQTSC